MSHCIQDASYWQRVTSVKDSGFSCISLPMGWDSCCLGKHQKRDRNVMQGEKALTSSSPKRPSVACEPGLLALLMTTARATENTMFTECGLLSTCASINLHLSSDLAATQNLCCGDLGEPLRDTIIKEICRIVISGMSVKGSFTTFAYWGVHPGSCPFNILY